ncbi:MAG: bifunctional adenosylcobinamide kinase/adenosylcobinamide-phosphate guanylyltransferase [Clostridia bacterium]|nr:bifunctional adenosylcobinamide kinase/adenosylcobinamide-phosphate guanylyltransferase [Clostridia bacterium]
MILVTGGAASGKRAYAASLGFRPEDMADAVLDGRPVVYNAQDMAARAPEDVEALAAALAGKALVLLNEVGAGVIPASPEAREAREAAGRLGILLAQRAERVVRMVAGIAVVIREGGA